MYRNVQDAEDAEEEQEDLSNIEALEEKLLTFDPKFSADDTYQAREAHKRRLTSTFLYGSTVPPDPEDPAQMHQIHLNVERIRVPEVSWQPYMAGVDQAGVGELSAFLMHGFDSSVQESMAKNVLVTGRYSNLPQFDGRLERVLRSTLPPHFALSVRRARDTRFDPWLGMRRWVRDRPEAFNASSVTRAEYEEKGSNYFKDHPWCSAYPF